eukprot:UN27703
MNVIKNKNGHQGETDTEDEKNQLSMPTVFAQTDALLITIDDIPLDARRVAIRIAKNLAMIIGIMIGEKVNL